MIFSRSKAIYSNNDTPFERLRKKAHIQSDKEVRARLRANPFLTKEEIALGTFVEEIEPQVRQAVRTFNRKGYMTWSSGFYGEASDRQGIDGTYRLANREKRILRKMGCTVRETLHFGMHYTMVMFQPETADLNDIRRHWNKIARVLPDLGKRAPHSVSWGAELFREAFAPDFLAARVQEFTLRLKTVKTQKERNELRAEISIRREFAAVKKRYARTRKQK